MPTVSLVSRSSKYQLLSWLTLFVFPYSLACQAEKENGFPMHSDVLRHSLLSALEAKGPDYQPRTEHRLADGAPRYTNRLILEDSPYLIQHAHNPVNWYAWGDEAFERARQEDKPVFLSIGYSTCHWCHVMERESFDNEEIAALMNEMFVCIKVDREQRPDLDEIYMTALHVTGQRGGWPMSSFLTAGRQPFYGGTYFPPQQFAALMRRVDEAWSSRREQLMETARQITEAVQRATATSGRAEAVGESAISEAASQILSAQDRQLGGAAGAPKFPHESQLLFLIDLAARRRDPALLEAIETSLDHMARGGINDQVGGGFHRYSTDSRWLVPHFEKMLYNQAHLSRAYVAGWQLTGNPFYARVARQTLDYVLREMRDDGGGFYSATDADSEGDEGLFFLWSDEQLRDELSEDDAQLAIDLFGVSSEGNFEGSNILHLPLGLEAFASSRGLEQEDLLERVDTIRETLWQAREAREHPLRDDKLLLAWNGMMITSLAAAADAFGSERYLGAAAAAAEFLWRHLRREPGKFWRVYLDGSASIPALQEDHAYFAEALLGLFDASGDEVWLHRAQEVTSGMLEQFWDSEEGGFFLSSDEIDDDLIARPKPAQDGAIPSSNSVALRVLSRLFARSGDPLYRERANGLLSAFSDGVRRSPGGYPYLLMAAGELLGGETGPDRYAAGGHLSVRTFLESDDAGPQLTLELRIAAGWHINSSLPLQDELIALELSADDPASWVLGEVDYPAAEEVVLGFQEEPLSVYRGTIHIATRLQHAAGDSEAPQATLRLRVQACNDELCLRPETLLLQVPVAAGRRLLD